MSEDKPQWGEWIDHDGGPCPIPNAKAYDFCVRFREDSQTRELWPSHWAPIRFDWSHNDWPLDIIAYRVRES